ncbi:hypothetical protein [Iodobacter ciconiae]|uniref:Phosphoglycerate mutase n=1 Tax=Iodobacter ciconiae TaxID=2496266 RepID=A0A3S8ZSX8_9NEIS|nr:hypothetical protein [Iodobacter ciconiae]AZN36592.1 hypothetical protein EJO50_08835 [Iodobacter ciconiae]
MSLHLLVSYADWPDADQCRFITTGLALPALALLCGRGKRAPAHTQSVESWLAGCLGMDTLPAAALSLGVDFPVAQAGFWLRADPVHLKIERDGLLLFDAQHFQISQAEAEALVAGLNSVFGEDGMQFVVASPTRWYLRLPCDPQLTWTSLDAAIGRDINTLLPKGTDELKWHRVLNEIQMYLYTHAVNDKRPDAQTINSLWLWGGSYYPVTDTPVVPEIPVYTNDLLLRGSMQLGGSDALPLPANADGLPVGDALVMLDHLRLGACYGNAHDWREGWLALEKNWFAPLLADLKSGKRQSLAITFPDLGLALQTNRSLRWKIWQKPKLPWDFL